ncbi:TIGR02117 family protein [Cytophagaceae bacterium YF14B1]|uniref:TIGR02117 family protein n=1 Tax=Xanthocytophaga flava TaxID=3048013 RepID=A0AAE3QLY2_9BACT|nr:TIGR02117 family protein [Xanthocytophaga flavus]MDJ1479885.1 TIGR02117 family protein [Xanthocytophaga flavus]
MNITKQRFRKVTIYLVRTLGIIICLVVLYLILAGLGMMIPVNKEYQMASEGIPVFVTTNGFHTDVILPVKNRRDKCFRVLQQPDLSANYANYPYISFGWGDRNFYMESYNNNFPSVTTILSTLFIPGKTLMHVDFYKGAPRIGKQVKKLILTPEQYERLVDFVNASFFSENESFVKLPQAGYYETDYFFEAQKRYHLFNTCNVWTGEALAAAGIKVSYWTPLESAVFYYL